MQQASAPSGCRGAAGLHQQQQRHARCLATSHSQHSSRSRRVGCRAAAPARTSSSISDMSATMKQVRSSMEQDEQLKVLMAGFRGSNLDESDFASAGVRMRLVTDLQDDGLDAALPLAYDPDAINRYWDTRPTAVITRIVQLMSIAGSFISGLLIDLAQGKLKEHEVKRAIQLRDIVTSLGPAYIKLGQALSIRPDILSPAAMNELQKLCDKVPSFDSTVAMQVVKDELGAPWYEIYADLTPEPIAAASLGQVYRGRLKTGEEVAVKVQRPGVLETVTVDLYIIRKLGLMLKNFPQLQTDVVALLDEWATRFFCELDYVQEGQSADLFAQQMARDLPQVVVPRTYSELTSRRVLTVSWLDGEKLSQSKADDVGDLVNIGVICYLKQLLDTGFFHADPHPGNLIRTPDGRLAILDFGLMTQVDDDIKFGMIEAISHLIHRDYEAIVQDFVTLQFIPPGTDLQPILPVLAKVFDQALEGGGAKNINFQELAADLAQITFDYPFRIPPYFALIIRAIGVLEGIALVGDPEFALVDEAYPYIAKRLLTDPSPRLQAALRYMVYGKAGIFDADRLIDLLNAFESFTVASQSSRGDMDQQLLAEEQASARRQAAAAAAAAAGSSGRGSGGVGIFGQQLIPQLPQLGLPLPAGAAFGDGVPMAQAAANGVGLFGLPANRFDLRQQTTLDSQGRLREALRFIFSPEGTFFRSFLLDEVVKSIDALSREQLVLLVSRLGLQGVQLPVLLPGAKQAFVPLSPSLSDEDKQVVENVVKIVNFLTKGSLNGSGPDASIVLELLPVMPTIAREVLPQVTSMLISRISARAVRELYA